MNRRARWPWLIAAGVVLFAVLSAIGAGMPDEPQDGVDCAGLDDVACMEARTMDQRKREMARELDEAGMLD